MIVFLSENEIFFQFSFKYSNNLAVSHNILWYFVLFLCFKIVHLATYISKFPPFLYTYRNLESYSFRQMLHYLPFLNNFQF